jgi:hypothetical protein
MNKENKLVPGLPSGFEDRWDKKLLLKKKLLKVLRIILLSLEQKLLKPLRLKLVKT